MTLPENISIWARLIGLAGSLQKIDKYTKKEESAGLEIFCTIEI